MYTTFEHLSTEKQKLIVKGALLEFATYGYENASTNRLVNSLCISKGSLFKYFNSKRGLFKYLIDLSTKDLLEHLDTFVPPSHNPIDTLVAYASLEYDYLIDQEDYYLFFRKVMKDLSHPDLLDIAKELTAFSLKIYGDLFSSLVVDDQDISLLHAHVAFILTGYNQQFMNQFSNAKDWALHKPQYIEELKSHLEMIKWSNVSKPILEGNDSHVI